MKHLSRLGLATIAAIAIIPLSSAIALASPESDRAAIEKVYSDSPIEKEIALSLYELGKDHDLGLKRLEVIYKHVGEGRRAFLRPILINHYLMFGRNIAMYDDAQRYLNRAAELNPADPRPYRQLRHAHCLLGKFKKCRAAHIQAVQRSGDEVGELSSLASSLELVEQNKAAAEVVKQALEAELEKPNPDKKEVWRLKQWFIVLRKKM